MARLRNQRQEAGLKRYELWLPDERGVGAAVKKLENMDADSISALLADNTCERCGEYVPFTEQKHGMCETCADDMGA